MHMNIYDRLIELARGRHLTTYGDIAPLAGLNMEVDADRDRISKLLGEILRHEASKNRPLLTAIVVHHGDDNNPGEVFIQQGQDLLHPLSGHREEQVLFPFEILIDD